MFFITIFLLPVVCTHSSDLPVSIADEKLAGAVRAAEEKLRQEFEHEQIAYPPHSIILIGLKKERTLEVWVRGQPDRPYQLWKQYPILAASGVAGPKLREGDEQVPEGEYRIIDFNTDTQYHLGLELDYPNAFDRARAAEEERTEPGSDIYIHGGDFSEGCLAMGDPAIEELFALTARTGLRRVRVWIWPNDLRSAEPETDLRSVPDWTTELYRQLLLNARVLERKAR